MSQARDSTRAPATRIQFGGLIRLSDRHRAIARVVLGLAQMFGAAFSLVLLLRLGVTWLSLTAVALTCLSTTVSVLLFGSRPPRGDR